MAVGLFSLARSQQYYGTLIRGSDAYYYHAFTRSLVFDFDTDITNDIEAGPNPWYLDPEGDRTWANVPRRADGGFRMKHPIGVSVLAAPGLAAGRLVRLGVEAVGIRVDGAPGYSVIELYGATASLLLVVAIGLALVYEYAAELTGRWPAVVGLLGCLFGTSLFHYAAIQSYWAHGVSFGMLVMFMAASRPLWGQGPVNRALVALGAASAMIALIRPQQAIVGLFLLPVLFRVVRTRRLSDWVPGALGGLGLCLLAAVLQMWINAGQFGQWTVNAYQASGEHFMVGASENPLPMRVYEVLFLRYRGLLIFSPIVILAALGFLRFFRSVPAYVWPAVGNALAQIVVIAAWSPFQGESFGARMWADDSFVMVFGLALLFHRVTPRWRWIFGAAALASVANTFYHLAKHMGLLG